MLHMLADLRSTVFATGPLSLCRRTPCPFSPRQLLYVPYEQGLTNYLIVSLIT